MFPQRGLVISWFPSIYFTVKGAKNIIRYTEDFVISTFHYSLFELMSYEFTVL